jgi:hypothetical protein
LNSKKWLVGTRPLAPERVGDPVFYTVFTLFRNTQSFRRVQAIALSSQSASSQKMKYPKEDFADTVVKTGAVIGSVINLSIGIGIVLLCLILILL